MIFRSAERRDILDFYGQALPITVTAMVCEKQGKVVGVGGHYRIHNRVVVFTDHKPEMTKRERVVAANKFMSYLDVTSGEIIAAPWNDQATVLKHFGFKSMGRDVWRLER